MPRGISAFAIAQSPNFASSASTPAYSAVPAVSYPAMVPNATHNALPYFVYGSLIRVLPDIAHAVTSHTSSGANVNFSDGPGFPYSVWMCTGVVCTFLDCRFWAQDYRGTATTTTTAFDRSAPYTVKVQAA